MRLWPILLGFLLLAGHGSGALAASQKAAALRQANGLTAFTPPEKFLAGNFVAEEMNPAFIFGTVKAFAASRKCPTAWLRPNTLFTWKRTARIRWSTMSLWTKAA
ncbi:MAG: hypothetical protein HY743_01680 [Deltaproteobacteria bacterium]|nr:hypothetical protein [Deltaproteobacteria bacterium]